MFSSQSSLPTHLRRAPQATLFHAIQVAEHNGNDEDEDEDEYGADPTPSSSAEPTTTAKEEEEEGRGAEGELLEQTVSQSSPTQSRDRFIETSSVAPSSAAAVHSMSMSTLLALSSVQQPELKLLGENNNNRTSGTAATADEEEQKKQREREHKKRSKNWTRPETLHLIRLRAQLEPRFAKSGRKTELWDEIAEALQREHISRDAQQCRDKWEKLTAGYKEVRDGAKDREDNPFYDELHPLLSGKPMKRERERDEYVRDRDSVGGELAKDLSHELGSEAAGREKDYSDGGKRGEGLKYEEEDEEEEGDARGARARKKKRAQKYMAITDVAAVQYVLETMITRQQKLFRELLESMERKEMVREQMRQEKEEKWQAEERAHRSVFHNAMIVLTQKLVGESIGGGGATATTTTTTTTTAAATTAPTIMVVGSPEATQGPKRRSKNWKRAEVLQLIKLRGEMEGRFGKSTRHAPLWDELAELLSVQGIKRDGKQCREKWDKLMAEYKDVSGGKRDQRESPYFAELTSILGRFSEAG
ncbi:hypothetical protein BDL97_13G063800 [Sphagnum fallax]|nr:hypothetical protein BDL97_13G063800 [Sphagnum fallax]KAH8943645.1 hypothetical protein BDL97_13G063800 [Sphagnum fallax]